MRFDTGRCPCKKGCPDRSAECHATCAKYSEFVENENNRRHALEESKKSDYDMLRYYALRKARRERSK